MERVFFHLPGTIRPGRDRELLVAVGEITFVVLELCEFLLHRLAHRGKRAVDTDDRVSARGHLTVFCFQRADRFGQINVDAPMIEMDSNIRIALRRFDHSGVERGATDRVDALGWINIVRREMQSAGFVVNHPAAHCDRMFEHFISDAELLERVNPTRGKREIDRPPPDNIALARVGPPLVKIDIVSAPPQVRAQQSAGQAATDENKFYWH